MAKRHRGTRLRSVLSDSDGVNDVDSTVSVVYPAVDYGRNARNVLISVQPYDYNKLAALLVTNATPSRGRNSNGAAVKDEIFSGKLGKVPEIGREILDFICKYPFSCFLNGEPQRRPRSKHPAGIPGFKKSIQSSADYEEQTLKDFLKAITSATIRKENEEEKRMERKRSSLKEDGTGDRSEDSGFSYRERVNTSLES
ncbi:hypothetical protein AVEN_115051-1 [Araneus ventricosus]|uniref:Uncharacterized protein n=1 Tax=Araneus ventricosus TaxID=182803 RepID=A0A4Y1ZX04_ARAVE|nr:hypothetical protein AVEN_115051-1 [Araneus ventricosus]